MRRLPLILGLAAVLSFSSVAQALTVRDVVELTKAGVSDPVLLALIQIDHRVYTIDAEAVKAMKAAGVSDAVMLAMIKAGRDAGNDGTDAVGPAPAAADAAVQPAVAPPPQVVVIDHGGSQPLVSEVPVAVPVVVPVAVPVATHQDRIRTIVTTDTGAAVRVREPVPPNCVKAEPIYWGNGGKRRPGTWAPPPQIVCR